MRRLKHWTQGLPRLPACTSRRHSQIPVAKNSMDWRQCAGATNNTLTKRAQAVEAFHDRTTGTKLQYPTKTPVHINLTVTHQVETLWHRVSHFLEQRNEEGKTCTTVPYFFENAKVLSLPRKAEIKGISTVSKTTNSPDAQPITVLHTVHSS